MEAKLGVFYMARFPLSAGLPWPLPALRSCVEPFVGRISQNTTAVAAGAVVAVLVLSLVLTRRRAVSVRRG